VVWIYIATRKNGEIQVEHLGLPLNSRFDDFGLVAIDSTKGYLPQIVTVVKVTTISTIMKILSQAKNTKKPLLLHKKIPLRKPFVTFWQAS
jgi:hypothetical protein